MTEEEIVTPVRTRRQKAEEEAGLAEALRVQEEELAEAQRRAEEERLNFEAAMEYQSQESPARETEIDWSDPKVQKYHAMKNKPVTIAQARKNMITYLKHQANYKDKDFKGMSYNDIRPIFERTWKSIQEDFRTIDFEKEKTEPRKNSIATKGVKRVATESSQSAKKQKT